MAYRGRRERLLSAYPDSRTSSRAGVLVYDAAGHHREPVRLGHLRARDPLLLPVSANRPIGACPVLWLTTAAPRTSSACSDVSPRMAFANVRANRHSGADRCASGEAGGSFERFRLPENAGMDESEQYARRRRARRPLCQAIRSRSSRSSLSSSTSAFSNEQARGRRSTRLTSWTRTERLGDADETPACLRQLRSPGAGNDPRHALSAEGDSANAVVRRVNRAGNCLRGEPAARRPYESSSAASARRPRAVRLGASSGLCGRPPRAAGRLSAVA